MENRVDRAGLHHLAVVHHDHLVGDFGHHTHVVGDEHDRHTMALLELLDQVQDFRLRGDVQRGGGLIRDQ